MKRLFLLILLIALLVPIAGNTVEMYGMLNGGAMFEKGSPASFAVEGTMKLPALRNETSFIYSDLKSGEATIVATYEMVSIAVSKWDFAIGGGLWQQVVSDGDDKTNAAMKLRASWLPFEGIYINAGCHYAPIPNGADRVFPFIGLTLMK